MAVMNRAQFKRQLQLGLNTVFGQEYKRYPEEWRDAFDVDTSRKAYEEDVLMTGLGAAKVKAEGAGVDYDSGSEAWVARYYHQTIALAFSITEEAVEDGLYGDLGAKFSRALARSMQHTKEILGANIFNYGFDASGHPIGDGAALFSTQHPLVGGGYAANTPTTQADLAESSLEDALTAIGALVDDRGIPVALQARRLLVPIQLQFVAERLTQSQLRPGTADNDVNAILNKGMLPEGYAINHRFTDTNAWFIKTDVPDGLKHFVRKPLQRGMEGDFESGNLRYKARERFSFGVTDWRGAYGSSGSV
jgi:hypothetical protein